MKTVREEVTGGEETDQEAEKEGGEVAAKVKAEAGVEVKKESASEETGGKGQ